ERLGLALEVGEALGGRGVGELAGAVRKRGETRLDLVRAARRRRSIPGWSGGARADQLVERAGFVSEPAPALEERVEARQPIADLLHTDAHTLRAPLLSRAGGADCGDERLQ